MVLDLHVIEDSRNGQCLRYFKDYGLDYWKFMMTLEALDGWKWQSLDSVSVKAPLGGT
jgi:hypothetical protein